MTEYVRKGFEVWLNGVRYPITGLVQPFLASGQPEKQVIGDYSVDSDPYMSSWVLGDFTGGMLVEELDEEVHAKRYYYGTLDTRFRREVTLPPLVTTLTETFTPAPTAASIVNGNMELTTGWTGGNIAGTWKIEGSYSWAVTSPGTAYQDATTWTNDWRGKAFTVVGCIYNFPSGSGTANGSIVIDDGVGQTESEVVTAQSTATWVCVTRVLDASATRLRIILKSTNGSGGDLTFFDAVAVYSSTAFAPPQVACEMPNVLYFGCGNVLCKLNATGDGLTPVLVTPATITDLFHDGSYLYVFCGDNQYYFYGTNDVFRPTYNNDAKDAYLGIYWDAKVFKVTSAGKAYRLDNPTSASPTAVSVGDLPIGDDEVQRLFIYFDANGDNIIYAATKRGLFALDYANAIWASTSLKLPSHTLSGKGAAVWRDRCYISSGLNVHAYQAGNVAVIESVGLDNDDSLPSGRGGGVTALVPGFNELFALVDSTYEGTSSRSQVITWDGKGWRTIWEATSNNVNLYTGVVSSVYSQRFWFSHTDGLSYITLATGNLKPKNQTYSYAASGYLITPWFDANWVTSNKNALRVKVITDDCSASETVVVQYRLDHSYTDLTTGWTTLGTITTDGLTELTFGSSAEGVSFREIQFKFSLARGATATNSPVLLYVIFCYEKIFPRRWGWQFQIDCSKPYHGLSPNQLLDAVVSAVEAGTLVTFQFDDVLRYVRIIGVEGVQATGDKQHGEYLVRVIESNIAS